MRVVLKLRAHGAVLSEYTIVLGIVGVVLMFGVLLLIQTRFSVAQQKENSSDKLDIAVQRLEANEEESADRLAKYDDFSQAKVDTIAYYYENMPEDLGSVEEMANQWALSDLYILDAQENVIASSGGSADVLKDEALATLFDDKGAVTLDMTRYYIASMENGMSVVAGRDITEFMETEEELTSLAYSLHTIKVGSKGYIVVVNTQDNTIAYHPQEDLIGKSLADAQLDEDVMTDGYAGWAVCADEEFYAESRAVDFEDNSYQFIALRPRAMMQNTIMKMVYMITLMFAVVLAIIIIYFHFIRGEQDKKFEEDNEEMEYIHLGGKVYFNQTIGSKAIHVLIVGLVVIFLASFYLQTLSVLSTQSSRSAEKISDINDIFDENQEKLEDLKEEYVQEYEGRTKNIAYLIGKDPTLVDSERLIELSERAQVKYIYIFNEDGEVIESNGIFTEFTLSHDWDSASYEFWDVIKGSKDIVIKDAEDDVYDPGSYIQYIGTHRIDAPGMVELGISPQRLDDKVKAVETPYTLDNIAVENDGFTMAVNKEDSTLVYYPEEGKIGRKAKAVGLNSAALTDDYTGYQTIDDTKCFVSSMEYDGEFIYVAVPLHTITSGRLFLAAAATVISFIILMIIFILALIGEPQKVLIQKKESASNEFLEEPTGTFEIVTGSGKVRKVDSVISRWSLNTTKWKDCTAEEKLKRVIFWILAVVAVFLVAYMYTQRGSFDKNSILSYIINRRWEKVPNIFSFTYIAFVVIEVMVITSIVRRLLKMALANMGARAETIGRLFNSFIKYISVLGTLFYCMNFLGVDSSTILASAGLLTLIVGLGAQSLVSDILAGIFIVFEGEFRVGDIVTIGDWRGTVREIGIRSTKIEAPSQDIKILNNSKVSGVINMTKKYSFAAIDIGIEYDESLEHVESILDKELPLVKERVPSIASGPFYRGVSALGDSSVTIKIVAQCSEADRVQLCRDLNREMKLIFDKHNINIPFPQVVINQPTEHKKATKAEKASAEKFVQEQKTITEGMAESES